MEEAWKTIEGFDRYEVSSLGRVRSLSGGYCENKILTPIHGTKGYLQVFLYKKGTRIGLCRRIHKLVAEAFIPNPDNLPQINHKDENKQNNCVDNLEWCTAKYNNSYGSRIDRIRQSNVNNPVTSRRVEQLTLDGKHVAFYPSVSEAKRANGFKGNHICECCTQPDKHKTYKGFVWRYV